VTLPWHYREEPTQAHEEAFDGASPAILGEL